MKKAFTLIELLVVIAIIAILAAILFPVFAQAKVAAKKTTAISNQKQVNLGFALYSGDYDDVFPRQDGCEQGSALNPALKNNPGPGDGCTSSPFYNRTNHYSFQKWIMPYVKNVDLFKHPGRGVNDAKTPSCPNGQWSSCGQLTGSFAVNLSITGALNTFGKAADSTAAGQFRNSFLGGTYTSVPKPGETMLLLEVGNPAIAFAPTAYDNAEAANKTQTHYPAAFREIWAHDLKSEPGGSCTGLDQVMTGAQDDPQRVFAGGLVIGYADGHVKFMKTDAFLGATPSYKEYGTPKFDFCGITGGTNVLMTGAPNVANLNYPLWGLGN